jgi:hypothetical protein
MTEPDIPGAGLRVRIRRYIQPSLTPGDIARQMNSDVEATIASVGARGRTIDVDPASALVHYVADGKDREAPYGTMWRVGLGYVFLGGKPQEGTCMYLVTEVEVLPAGPVWERLIEMCGHPGCLHFVDANPAYGDGPGIAEYDHLDDGEKDHDHDAIRGGGIRTLAGWKALRPELFAEYADGKIGPNSALCTPEAGDPS